MIKRVLLCLLSALSAVILSGCWNYRGLDQLNIVVGIAIDFDQEENLFDITYEVADLTKGDKNSNAAGKTIHAKGATLFDTARNAKRKEADRLFFGTAHVLIVSQQVAREIGILSSLDWFLRDGECRETMYIAISEEKTAGEILKSAGEMNSIISEVLYDILREDKQVTGTSSNVQIYEAYNSLHSPRKSTALPVLRKIKHGDKEIPETNGMAIIKNDQLTGLLTPEQSRYMMAVEGELKGGILTLSMSDMPVHDISLEVLLSETKKSYTHEQQGITVHIETNTHVAIAENRSHMDMMDEQVIQRVEAAASCMVQEKIENLIHALQHEFNADVLGFGEMIYKKDLKLWNRISSSWEEIYPAIRVEVSSNVKVLNTAFTK